MPDVPTSTATITRTRRSSMRRQSPFMPRSLEFMLSREESAFIRLAYGSTLDRCIRPSMGRTITDGDRSIRRVGGNGIGYDAGTLFLM